MAQPGSALAWGRKFESCYRDQGLLVQWKNGITINSVLPLENKMPKPKIHPRIYNCIHCATENEWTTKKNNKFCNHSCQQNYRWINETKPLIESGKKDTNNLRALLKYVRERDGYKCKICDLTNWQGNPISLDLDHIDGNNKNNFPSNLRLLCPNCHRQTPTWGNKTRSGL